MMKVGLCGAVFLLLCALKLTGTIAWSWWWVTAPLWGGALLALLVMGAAVFAYIKLG